jgi:class 3 adenylate cyclase
VQREMRDHDWPDGVRVRLRIGIHRGRPTQSDGGYVGLAVNTAARICDAGHGDQTLLSATAAEALPGAIPVGVSLRNVGAPRLRGLRDPLPLLQVEAADLPSTFPPLRTVSEPDVAAIAVGPRGLGHHSIEQADRRTVGD